MSISVTKCDGIISCIIVTGCEIAPLCELLVTLRRQNPLTREVERFKGAFNSLSLMLGEDQ